MSSVKINHLKNNLTVAVDEMNDIQTASIYFCVYTGSLSETKDMNGISHFLEHMAFKGTEKRTAFQIAEEVDQIGAYINAYTSKEMTCYYIKLIDKYLEKGFDIISDIVQNSIFDPKEIEIERGAIIEELLMYLDSPGDVNYNNFMMNAFGDTPIGRDIIGSIENIKRFDQNDLKNYENDHYHTGNMILAVSGNVKEQEVLSLSEKYFNKLKPKKTRNEYLEEKYLGGLSIKTKENLEQMQFLLGFNTVGMKNRRSTYIYDLLSIVLGHGMSSRLFQEIREKRGLVYSVYSDLYSLKNNGLFMINLSSNPEKAQDFVPILKDEIKKISNTITEKEVEKAKNQILSQVVMSEESSNARASRMVSCLYNFDRFITNKEIFDDINSITKDEIEKFSEELFSSKPTISVYYDDSKFSNSKINDIILENFKL